ncbi:hypothetical protein [Streptosporangium carneum]|uniref:hypothetical protein n=1 Tax=Streptosporangium carneum TaxID=47481 RepID=UPI0022F3482B|nr:hypothetical protein [Streptosporangium carneum]
MIHQPESEVRVDLRLPQRVGLGEELHRVAELAHERRQLASVEHAPAGRRHPAKPVLRLRLAGLLLPDPSGDHRGVGTGLQGGTVLGEPAVAVGDLAAGHRDPLRLGRQQVLGGQQVLQGAADVRG